MRIIALEYENITLDPPDNYKILWSDKDLSLIHIW